MPPAPDAATTSEPAPPSVDSRDAAAAAARHYDADYTRMLQKADDGLSHRRTRFFEPHVGPEHSVLDFGCGPGTLLETLPARSKHGVEISETSREVASGRGIDVRPDLSDFTGMTFDRVISSHCLEHVVDPASKLTAIRSMLRDDGLFVLLVPLNEWGHRPQRKYDPAERNKHLYTWTPLLLGNLLTVCGFEVVDVRAVHFWHPPKIGSALLRLSPPLYRLAGGVYSRLTPRRQILALARKA